MIITTIAIIIHIEWMRPESSSKYTLRCSRGSNETVHPAQVQPGAPYAGFACGNFDFFSLILANPPFTILPFPAPDPYPLNSGQQPRNP